MLRSSRPLRTAFRSFHSASVLLCAASFFWSPPLQQQSVRSPTASSSSEFAASNSRAFSISRFLSSPLLPIASAEKVSAPRSIQSKRHFGSMRATNNDGNGGDGITLVPASGEYRNVVIWMHGLGDTADGWADAMPSFTVANTKYVLPTASARPITINGGYRMPGWSDILGLSDDAPEDKAGFESSRSRIDALIQREVDQGVPPSRIVLAGFSQGGALALHTAMRSSHHLGGCIVLSSWLPFRDEYPGVMTDAAKHLRVFQAHGEADMVVSYQWGHGSHDLLKTLLHGEAPKFLAIPGMGHSSHPNLIDAVDKFLHHVLKSE